MKIAQYFDCSIGELVELGVPKLKEIYRYLAELLDELDAKENIANEEYLMLDELFTEIDCILYYYFNI